MHPQSPLAASTGDGQPLRPRTDPDREQRRRVNRLQRTRQMARSFTAGLGPGVNRLAESELAAIGPAERERLRSELVRIARVATRWIDAIDRRHP